MKSNGKTTDDRRPRLSGAALRPRSGPHASRGRIVVASEDGARRRSIVLALTRAGCDAREAAAPLELFKTVGISGPSLSHPTRPDVVVLDVTGSEWATLEMLELVCSEHWTLPVVVLARPNDEEAHAEARRLGAAAILELPVDESRLCAEIFGMTQPSLSTSSIDAAIDAA
jgi:AmiR/NasT family two-component response regulator